MPYLMALEGPRVDRMAQLRGELYSTVPRPFWRASSMLNGVLDPFMLNKLWVGAGIVIGAWLAGSAKGRSLVSRVASKVRR